MVGADGDCAEPCGAQSPSAQGERVCARPTPQQTPKRRTTAYSLEFMAQRLEPMNRVRGGSPARGRACAPDSPFRMVPSIAIINHFSCLSLHAPADKKARWGHGSCWR